MENARFSSGCSFISHEMIVLLPVPDGADTIINLPFIFFFYFYHELHGLAYSALSTCSLICSSSSFMRTTMFCISAWFDFEPVVLISRPIS